MGLTVAGFLRDAFAYLSPSTVKGLWFILKKVNAESLSVEVDEGEVEGVAGVSVGDLVNGLVGRHITACNESETVKMPLFSHIVCKKDAVVFFFNPKTAGLLREVRSVLSKVKPTHIAEIRSTYSLLLYIWLKKEGFGKKIKKRFFTLGQLREALGIPDSYRKYDVKRRVLDQAKSELKDTDVPFDYREVEKGKESGFEIFLVKDGAEVAEDRSKTANKGKKGDSKLSEYRKYIGKVVRIGGIEYFIGEDGIKSGVGGWKVEDILKDWERWGTFLKRTLG